MKSVTKVFNSIIEKHKIARENKRSWVLFYIVFIGVFALITSLHRNVYMSVRVSGESMADTLTSGNVLVVDKCAEITRGDVIVFYKNDTIMYIKRVIALPGDTVWSENGSVYISYQGDTEEVVYKLEEPYAKGQTYFSYYVHEGETFGSKDMPKVTVDEGRIFVLGDNREISYDSRKLGCISQSKIVGKVTEFSIEHKDSWFNFIFKLI